MNNIFSDISKKIEPSFADALSEVKKIADDLSIPFFLIGAKARDCILEYHYDIRSPRVTEDIDIAVLVPDWEKYKTLTDALLATSKFSKEKQKQRYAYNDTLIDIVPFGPISGKNKEVKWPPECEVIMSTFGFEEIYKHAITLRLRDNPILDVKMPTIPGLAIMKLISWSERNSPERQKDAKDLLFIMKNYEDAGIESRLYEKESSLLEEEGFDNQLAGIRLLGRDMAKISNADTLEKIKEILSNETGDQTQYELISNMLGISGSFEETLMQLEKLEQGVSEVL
ncbi:MAG: nucleotidyl transferase AbiEii/AbiGii toxin family protein [Candidatus Aureabacteria bacterium]|nr:nucleotidyl transferase AbiEii/AbiGii toxin family protein [Candidatus Auribacterota bacterium]